MMGRHTQNLSKPPKSTKSDYLSRRTTVCTQHTRTHLVILHPVFPLDSSNALKKSMVKNPRSPGVFSAERSSLALVRKATNCEIIHMSLKGKPYIMVALQVYQVRGSWSGFRNSWSNLPPNTSVCGKQTPDYLQPLTAKGECRSRQHLDISIAKQSNACRIACTSWPRKGMSKTSFPGKSSTLPFDSPEKAFCITPPPKRKMKRN